MGKNLHEKVEEILSSNVGSTLAKGALISHCKRIGITPEELDSDSIKELAMRIDEIFTTFYGKETGEYLSNQLMKLE